MPTFRDMEIWIICSASVSISAKNSSYSRTVAPSGATSLVLSVIYWCRSSEVISHVSAKRPLAVLTNRYINEISYFSVRSSGRSPRQSVVIRTFLLLRLSTFLTVRPVSGSFDSSRYSIISSGIKRSTSASSNSPCTGFSR